MTTFQNPNPEWPKPVRKMVDGKIDTKYTHNKKEFEKFTNDPAEGGLGYTTSPIGAEYPKAMSHPDLPDVTVNNEKEEKAKAKQGYNFDHYDNKLAKEHAAKMAQAEASKTVSFDPSAQHKIEKLENQLKEQNEKFEKLMEKLGA